MTKAGIAVTVVLLIFLGAAIWLNAVAWTGAGDVHMSGHAIFAMILGIVFSLAVGCGLMFLVFYSSRAGYDDQVHDFASRHHGADDSEQGQHQHDPNRQLNQAQRSHQQVLKGRFVAGREAPVRRQRSDA